MLSSAARISFTSQMLRSWVVFLGASTGTGLLMRMPHSTASRKELCSSWWTSWRVVPERVRFCCLGSQSIRNSATVTVDGDRQLPRPSTALLILGQCADPLAHGIDQRNDKRIPHMVK